MTRSNPLRILIFCKRDLLQVRKFFSDWDLCQLNVWYPYIPIHRHDWRGGPGIILGSCHNYKHQSQLPASITIWRVLKAIGCPG